MPSRDFRPHVVGRAGGIGRRGAGIGQATAGRYPLPPAKPHRSTRCGRCMELTPKLVNNMPCGMKQGKHHSPPLFMTQWKPQKAIGDFFTSVKGDCKATLSRMYLEILQPV